MYLINSLYIYIAVFSFWGAILFIKNEKKNGIVFIIVALLCITWRCFTFNKSTRYFSIFIFWGIYFSTYAVDCFCDNIKKRNRPLIVAILFIALFSFHIEKNFSSFRNNYILDIRQKIKTILEKEHESDVIIYKKEFERLSNNIDNSKNHLKETPIDFSGDLSNLFVSNGSFSSNMYCIITSDFNIFSYIEKDSLFHDKYERRFKKIAFFLSNKKHNKAISIYKHFPYTPSPDINLEKWYDHTNLKAIIPEYDTFIYQSDNKLVWLIGVPLEDSTTIIYHIHTDQPELLPNDRVEYGYNNGDFYTNDKSERKSIGKYRVYEKKLPDKYHITHIGTGFVTTKRTIVRKFPLSFEK